MGGLKEESLHVLGFACPCLNFPFWTSWSKWYFKFLQFLVVCLGSRWYWQYRLWLRFAGSPAILFGHLKNGSFLTFSKTWCIGSRNTACNACTSVGLDCPAKSPLGRLLLNQSDWKSVLSWGTTFALPFPSCWSSSTLLYLSIWSMSWRRLVTGFPLGIFLNHVQLGGRSWNCWWWHCHSHLLSHCAFPSIYLSRLLVSPLLEWTKIEGNLGAEEPCYSW